MKEPLPARQKPLAAKRRGDKPAARRPASQDMPPEPQRGLTALSVTSELFPMIKTGGLADVAGALPDALRSQGVGMHSLLPAYPGILGKLTTQEECWRDETFFGGPARIVAGRAGTLNLFVLDAPHLYARPGGPYSDQAGRDWPDNPQRFAALSHAAALLARGLVAGFTPDILHAHDWQTGLAPAYLALSEGPRPASIFTVHNLAFHGWTPARLLASLALPPRAWSIDGVEFFGGIGLLKAGLYYADRITTVSPTYAAEIRTTDGGQPLDGLLRARGADLSGILNGIDTRIWNPADDPFLPAAFDARDPSGKQASKFALQSRFNLDSRPDHLLYGIVSRLSDQKGLDLVLEALDDILASGAQLAMLGSGDLALQAAFTRAAAAHPGRIGVQLGYDEAVAHLIQAGSDAILVPSRFEPCGLTQLCALRYGTIPVVSRVGGLADTVIDANEAALAAGVATGIQFSPVTPPALRAALAHVSRLWGQPTHWKRLQANAMAQDVGWAEPARRYAALYREAIAARRM